jgi:hypothetical protein
VAGAGAVVRFQRKRMRMKMKGRAKAKGVGKEGFSAHGIRDRGDGCPHVFRD